MASPEGGGFREKLRPFIPLALVGGVIAIIAKIASMA